MASAQGFAVAPGFSQGLHWKGFRIDADVNCLQAFCLSLLERQVSARVDLSMTSCTGNRWLCSVTLNSCTCVGVREEAYRSYMALHKKKVLVCVWARPYELLEGFDVLLTVNLSIIPAINQLNAQILVL